jgi:DNA topoisomerase-6 subunit B
LPFLVEVGLAYGGEIKEYKLLRFANRVPLLYDQSACAITEATKRVSWKSYGLSVDKSGNITDKVIIVVHLASVWVPFTSESKYAIAHYEEIINEIVKALQEVGRKFSLYLQRKKNLILKLVRKKIFEAYARIVAERIKETLVDVDERKIKELLMKLVEEKLGIEKTMESLKKYLVDEKYIKEIIKKELGIKRKKGKREEIEEE